MEEARKQPRMHVVSYLKISEHGNDRDLGRVFDITTDGLRLQASDPIDANSVYEFEMAMPPRKGPGQTVRFDGEVVWCRKSAKSGYYDAGVQLRDVPDEVSEVLKQIIDDTPFESRRLNIHRPRPLEH